MGKSESAVVNLSTERYWPGQDRLVRSLQDNTDAAVLTFRRESDVGAYLHSVSNYGFKPLAMQAAHDIGYRYVLWLDASMNVIRPIQPIFDILRVDGYFFQDSGWPNSRWTNYRAYEYFGTNDGCMLSSGVLGLDMESDIGSRFFAQWLQSMKDGIFNGGHHDHRHDQTCASLIAHKLNMKLQDGNTFFVYGKLDEPTISEKTLILADGICL